MARTSLRREDTTPLHAQICAALRRRIQTGKLKSGQSFPSERELVDLYGVSRMTVRQAVLRLRHEGLIYYERGVGSFVSNKKVDLHTRNLVGFSEEMNLLGLKPSSRVMKIECEDPPPQIARELQLAPGEKTFHLERLRLADDEPMAYEDTYLREKFCPGLKDWDLKKNSLYQILIDNYGVQMHHASESLEAAIANKFIAKQLGIKVGAPVLLVQRLVFSDTNQPLESARTTYRADRYRATFYLAKNGR
ncbi:MAG TPA: GntR family transcriptional regulator [Pyrinomonadaceae bacterium]|nr:GntR family transcriptional regulator [Pyrinomonadaceae bacterium]